jgi:hypothetical protein
VNFHAGRCGCDGKTVPAGRMAQEEYIESGMESLMRTVMLVVLIGAFLSVPLLAADRHADGSVLPTWYIEYMNR